MEITFGASQESANSRDNKNLQSGSPHDGGESATSSDLEKNEENTGIDAQGISVSPVPPIVSDGDKGMSEEEYNDPNKIKVTIADKTSPLIIMFGPPSCGKTMTLIRLTRYLKGKGYTVEPITSFRPSYDTHYTEMCDNFDTMINSDDAATATGQINFLLVKVFQQGKAICQILEGPGELYFSPQNPKANYPAYLNTIIHSKNRKIWLIMVEPDRTNKNMDTETRNHYVAKIENLKKRIKSSDKVIFVFNKIDQTLFNLEPGKIKYSSAKKEVGDLYPGIFEPFKNENPITKLWKQSNAEFVVFQTGTFTETIDGKLTYQEGDEYYPKKLWEFINKGIRG